MRKLALGLVAACATVALVSVAFGAPGKLDRSFSGNGWRTTDFLGHNDTGLDVAVQDNGRVVVAGLTRLRGSERDFALARYRRNGRADRSFSSDGKLHTALNDFGDEQAESITLQPNGRLLAAGVTTRRSRNFAVVRYRRDGRLDDSFSGNGKKVTNFGGEDTAADAAVGRSGRIVVAGTTTTGTDDDFAVALYNQRGKLARKFTSSGNGSVELGDASAVELRPNGRILVAGTAGIPGTSVFAVARFTPGGQLDPSFGEAGIATFDIPARARDFLTSMAVRNGRILLGGATRTGDGPADFALARLNAGGHVDTSFSDDGWTTIDFGGHDDYLWDLTVQTNGKVVAVGGTAGDAVIARLRKNGALDRSFSGNGRYVLQKPGEARSFHGVALAPDGRIVVGGTKFVRFEGDLLAARFRD
jgi:uncharacterized delta-60 repeat protein